MYTQMIQYVRPFGGGGGGGVWWWNSACVTVNVGFPDKEKYWTLITDLLKSLSTQIVAKLFDVEQLG